MTEDEQPLPRRREGVRLRGEGRDALLVAPGQSTAYALNPTARAVWELCDGTTTIEELTDAICQVFAVERSTAVADVMAVLEGLEASGLVHWTPDAEFLVLRPHLRAT